MSLKNKIDQIKTIAVVGAGSWGTALAYYIAGQGFECKLWAFEEEVVSQITNEKENKTFLPDLKLPESIKATNDLESVVLDQDIVIMAVPSHFMRQILKRMVHRLNPGVIIVSAAKGIENETLMTMSQIFEDVAPDSLAMHRAVLSGPSFAKEVGQGLPTAVTVACPDQEASNLLQKLLSSNIFRLYTSQDLIGVELGGALKNVIAIGAGITDGLGLGLNARAALITRGLAEIMRLGVQMGANPLTFSGLAGIGDLFLTCTGDLSRNRTVGLRLGRGESISEIIDSMNAVAEGVKTAKSAFNLAARERVDMPLTEMVYRIIYEDMTPLKAMVEIMSRDLKPEIDH